MPKKWNILPAPPSAFVGEHPDLPTAIVRLLWNRQLRTQEQIDNFLNPDYSQGLHDPFLFKDMTTACEIIFKAIEAQKNIVIHGDYDADGVCAAAILVTTLKKFGAKNVSVFIPHREIDGYGLNTNTVNNFKEQRIDLIITCDCGVSNVEEIKLAKSYGMQVIITDHHSIPAVVPPADAIIHAKMPKEIYPSKDICGAAAAFKLAQGLLKEHKESHTALPDGQPHEGFEKWMLDLVAIATIGDMVPLLGESRTLTRYGISVLNKTRNLGLQKLLIAANIADENGKSKKGQYNAFTVGFQIVPRLNAAGRMDHANTAYGLLVAEDEAEAEKLATQLCKNNSERQKITEQMTSQAIKQIEESGQKDNPFLFVLGEDWGIGVLGLIAGRLKDKYYRPVMVMGQSNGEIYGSGRSIREFNMIRAMQSSAELFDKFGGHPQACGFTLKSPEIYEQFKATMIKLAEEETRGLDLMPQINIDAEVDLDEVDWKLYDMLEKFEPFGQANEEPAYLACGLTITSISPVGQDGKHLRLLLKHNSHVIRKTIGFGLGDPNRHPDNWKEKLKAGDKIDMVFSLSVNEWNGNRELEMSIEDIKKSA